MTAQRICQPVGVRVYRLLWFGFSSPWCRLCSICYVKSGKRYGGTPDQPNSSLNQVSGASPPGFLALSALVVNAYQCIDHGTRIKSAYVGRLFWLAAVMYVDDTDILHWPPSPHTDDDVQQAITDWGHLSHASSGILKAPKCSIYFLSYKFVCCHATLKTLHDLSNACAWITDEDILLPVHITIPQPYAYRPNLSIVTKDITTASRCWEFNFHPLALAPRILTRWLFTGWIILTASALDHYPNGMCGQAFLCNCSLLFHEA